MHVEAETLSDYYAGITVHSYLPQARLRQPSLGQNPRSPNILACLFEGNILISRRFSTISRDPQAILKASTQTEVDRVAVMPNGHIKRGH